MHASIDTPRPGANVLDGPLHIRGWALEESGPLEAALLVVGDGPAVPARLGIWREDLSEHFPSVPHACASGFEGTVDLRADTAGNVRIALLTRTSTDGWQEAAAVDVIAASPIPERQSARPRAAFTIVQDEPVMLPLWLRYYGRYFDPEDLYVIDHDSTDGSTTGLEGHCRIVPVHRQASFDHNWLRSTVEAFQIFLLRSYSAVAFSEVDEFVVADPRRYTGLDGYIDAMTTPSSRCTGFQVVHQPDEPPLSSRIRCSPSVATGMPR